MPVGVPVALATDDEGVSRSNMTHEYLKGAEEGSQLPAAVEEDGTH
jgi:adenosine deaminase